MRSEPSTRTHCGQRSRFDRIWLRLRVRITLGGLAAPVWVARGEQLTIGQLAGPVQACTSTPTRMASTVHSPSWFLSDGRAGEQNLPWPL